MTSGAAHRFWTDGFEPPARSWRSLLARCLAHLYLAGIALLNAALVRFGRRPAPARPAGRGLRILAVGPFLNENWVAAHLEGLAHCDAVERVVVITPERYREIESLEYVVFSPTIKRRIGQGWARLWSALKSVRADPPDVVIGYHLPWNGLTSLLLARAIGARVLYFAVGGPAEFLGGGCYSEHALFSRIGRESPALERRFLRLIDAFDGVLTMGTRSQAMMHELGVTAPVVPISVGVSAAKFVPSAVAEAASYDVVTVGRLAPIKRIDQLLRAVAKTPPAARPSVAVVGDGGEAANLRRLADELGIGDRVDFLGWRTDVEEVLLRSRCFVMSSASEGLPLALIEAMLSSLPAIVPDVGDISDLVRHGESGLLYEPGNADDLASCIASMLEDDDRLAAMAGQARKHALHYGVAARAQDWSRLLDGLYLPPPAR